MTKVAIVTGASRGIGEVIAKTFARSGAKVVLAARDRAALERVEAEIRRSGGEALAVPTDVTREDQVESLVRTTLQRYGRLDVACNDAAGGGHGPTPLADVSTDDFDASYAVSLRGVFVSMKHEIRAMLASGRGGAIVNVSSTAGVDAVAGLAAYVTMKHGLAGLTKTAALDYAARGIRVNAVAPGPIAAGALERAGEQAMQAAAAAIPMRRIGRAEDVAEAVLWLASDAAAFVTGATLTIDGGKLAGAAPFGARPDERRA